MKALIVDDEPLALERLERLIEETGCCELAGRAMTGREAVEVCDRLRPDVVLLDIQMPEMDGIEAAHHIKRMDPAPAVIFCTAYDEYALNAFEASAVDYLVKPVRAERLVEAIDRARRFRGVEGSPAALPDPDQRSHLCARMRGELRLVPIEDVLCLLAEHKYVTVVTADDEVLIEEPLVALEREFADRFLRVHRNALVALDRIRGLEKSVDGGTVVVLRDTERRLDVSRRNLPQVRKVVKNL
ncbi:MAG: LytTR family DNA-binding domain-containing protein [Pseudomonadota bacterium]